MRQNERVRADEGNDIEEVYRRDERPYVEKEGLFRRILRTVKKGAEPFEEIPLGTVAAELRRHSRRPPGDRRTTVVYIIDILFELAGSEHNLYDVVTHLDAARYRPLVLCMHSGNAGRWLREMNIPVIDLSLRKIYSPEAAVKAWLVYRFLRQNEARIVVTYHESSDYFGGLIAKAAGVPVVISSRRDMGYSLQERHHRIYRRINGIFDRIITVSEAVKKAVHEKQQAPWHKLLTIYNGTDIGKYSSLPETRAVRRSLGLDPGRPVVGIVAVFRRIKGHRYFFEAAAEIVKKYPKAYFLAVGWTPYPAYLEEMRRLVRELKLEDNVVFTGGRADIPAMYAAMDVVVFSSINEGFSNAVIEAMASGKAIVATDGGGTGEAVVDGVTGRLVPPRDSGAIAAAVVQLLDDPRQAALLAKNARRTAAGTFSRENMVRSIERLFDGLLEEKQAAREPASPVSLAFAQRLAKRSVKQGLAVAALRSGLLGRRHRSRNGIRILAYHRVTNDPFVLPGMAIRVANFEEHLRFFLRSFRPISLSDAVRHLSGEGEFPRHGLVITFDDGYRDNYLNAFPVLQRYGIPATVFLAVQAVDEQQVLWFDAVTEAFRRTRRTGVDFTGAHGLGRYLLDSAAARRAAANTVTTLGKTLSGTERDSFIRTVLERLAVSPEEIRSSRLMMNWDEIRSMRIPGMDFGSHGMSHTSAPRLPPGVFERELLDSRSIIGERLGTDVRSFAYPNGLDGDHNAETGDLLRKHGFSCACTLQKGFNHRGCSPWTLCRDSVSEGMESNAWGRFSPSLFFWKVS